MAQVRFNPVSSRSVRTLAVLTLAVPTALAFAALFPDRACCITTRELQEIGLCISGPGGLERPDQCGEAGRCYLAVGPSANGRVPIESFGTLAAGFLNPRAYCSSSFGAEDVQGTLRGGSNIDLFTIFDADQDGDLDLRDIGVFMETYEPAPFRVE